MQGDRLSGRLMTPFPQHIHQEVGEKWKDNAWLTLFDYPSDTRSGRKQQETEEVESAALTLLPLGHSIWEEQCKPHGRLTV